MCEIKFPARWRWFKLRDLIYREKNKMNSKWMQRSYVHCSMVWNCPWGSRGNYKAAQERDKKVVVLLLIFFLLNTRVSTGLWQQFLTLIWACSPEYSMDWKMCQVYLRLISLRATYWRYHRWIRMAALMAETQNTCDQETPHIWIIFFTCYYWHTQHKRRCNTKICCF